MNLLEKSEAKLARYQKVIDMYNDGYLTRVIAERCGISRQMVHYIIRESKVERRNKRGN